MTNQSYSRHIQFESVVNFRDLGGYRTGDGRTIAWRRLFRSGELRSMTQRDFDKLTQEIGLKSVIDLRSGFELEKQGLGLLSGSGIKYRNISFIPDGGDPKANEQRYSDFTNMGEFYIHLVKQGSFGKRIVQALEVIAGADNYPLVFHCAVGKDRTGILAAILLDILGVGDKDIIEDYAISGPFMKEIVARMEKSPEKPKDAQGLPGFFWDATPESMAVFLSSVRREYGSGRGYIRAQGADGTLFSDLEKALLA
jgi:protein-tyrosine phosphatase